MCGQERTLPIHTPPFTLNYTQKVFKNAHFSTFWLLIHGQTDRLKDGPTDQWMDKSSFRIACLQLQSRRRWIQHERTITSHPLYRRISVTPESIIAGCNCIFFLVAFYFVRLSISLSVHWLVSKLFSRVHATLHPALSVRRSVRWSVRWSVRPSIRPLVCDDEVKKC